MCIGKGVHRTNQNLYGASDFGLAGANRFSFGAPVGENRTPSQVSPMASTIFARPLPAKTQQQETVSKVGAPSPATPNAPAVNQAGSQAPVGSPYKVGSLANTMIGKPTGV